MSNGLLLLDVDGPLNPFAGTNRPRLRAGYTRYKLSPGDWASLPVWLHAGHGQALLALAEETGLALVWATTWQHDANRLISPRVGLPQLPAIEFETLVDWKYSAIAQYAEGLPIAWFDDDFDVYPEAKGSFLARRKRLPTLLHQVSPQVGLTGADFDAVREWAAFYFQSGEPCPAT